MNATDSGVDQVQECSGRVWMSISGVWISNASWRMFSSQTGSDYIVKRWPFGILNVHLQVIDGALLNFFKKIKIIATKKLR